MTFSAPRNDVFELSSSNSDLGEDLRNNDSPNAGHFGKSHHEDDNDSRQLDIQEALEELEICIRRGGGSLNGIDIPSNVNLLLEALRGESTASKCLAMEILIELFPRCLSNLDVDFGVVLPLLIDNVGHQEPKIRRCSVQSIHLFLQNTPNLQEAIKSLVRFGLKNESRGTSTELLLAFPLFVSPQFAKSDLHDLIYALALKMQQSGSVAPQDHPAAPCLQRLKTAIGIKKYSAYIAQLPVALQEIVAHCGRRSVSSSISSDSSTAQPLVDSPTDGRPYYNEEDWRTDKNTVHFGFVPSRIMEELNNRNDYRIRAQGIEKLKFLVSSVTNPDVLFLHLDQFVPFLLSYFDDVNFKVIVVSMEVLNELVSKLMFNLKPYVPQIIKALQGKLGELNLVIKQITAKSYLKLMQIFSPTLVLREIIPGVKHRSSKIREATVNLVTAGLLTFPSSDFDMQFVSSLLAPLLLDTKQAVRHAVMECFSVIAQALGPGKLAPVVSAVDKVEMMPQGEGAMAAVQAKLGRRQLPRIGTNGLIEYSLFLPSNLNTDQPQSPDVAWVLAGKPTIAKLKDSSQSVDLNSNLNNPPLKRFLSAGKKRLPWESTDDDEREQLTRKSVGSAPVRVKSPTPTKGSSQNNVMVNAYMGDKSPTYLDNHLSKTRNLLAASPNSQKSPQPASYYEMYKSKMKRIKAAGLQADHQMINSLSSGSSRSRPVVPYSKGSLTWPQKDGGVDYASMPLSPNGQGSVGLSPVAVMSSKRLSHSLSELDFVGVSGEKGLLEQHRPKSPRPGDSPRDPMSPVHVKPQIGRPMSRRRHSLSDVEESQILAQSGHHENGFGRVEKHPPKSNLHIEEFSDNSSLSQLHIMPPGKMSLMEPVKSPFESHPRVCRTPQGEKSPRSTGAQPQVSDNGSSSDRYEVVGFRFPYNEKGKAPHQKRITSQATSSSHRSGPVLEADTLGYKADEITNIEPFTTGLESQECKLSSGSSHNTGKVDAFDIEVNGTRLEKDIDQLGNRMYGLSNSAKARIRQKQQASQQKKVEDNSLCDTHSHDDSHDRLSTQEISPHNRISKKDVTSRNGGSKDHVQPNQSPLSLSGSTILPTPFNDASFFSPDDAVRHTEDRFEEHPNSNDNNNSSNITTSTATTTHSSRHKAKDAHALEKKHDDPNSSTTLPSRTLPSKLKIGQSPKLRKKPSSGQSTSSKSTTDDKRTESAGSSASDWNVSADQLLPLQNPDQGLASALAFLAATAEEWENTCEGLTLLRRLAAHHPAVLSAQLHAVMIIVNKEVKNLRSQVSRIAISCLGDMLMSLSKQMEAELEQSVSILLCKTGESNAFIRADVEKALYSLVSYINPQKALAALIASGAGHRNPQVRKAAAKFIAEVADRLGANRIVNGNKDATERLLSCITQFALDTHPETRYYGKRMILMLIHVPDIDQLLLKHASRAANAKSLRTAIETLRSKGLVEPPPDTGTLRLKKAASDVTSAMSAFKSSGDSSMSGTSGHGASDEVAPTSVKRTQSLKAKKRHDSSPAGFDFDRLSLLDSNDWKDRFEGVDVVYELARLAPNAFTSSIIKISDKFIPRLTDSNSKVLLHALQTFLQMIPIIGDGLSPVVVMVIQALTTCVASKNQAIYTSACDVLDCFLQFLDPSTLVQSFGTAIQFGNSRVKPEMTKRMAVIVGPVHARKPALVYRHILPVTWYLLGSSHSGSTSGLGRVSLNEATTDLCASLFAAFGEALLDEANSKGSRTRQKLEALLGLHR